METPMHTTPSGEERKKPVNGILSGLLYFGGYLLCQLLSTVAFTAGYVAFLKLSGSGEGLPELIRETTAYIQTHSMELSMFTNVLTLLVLGLVFLIKKKNYFKQCGIRKMQDKPGLWLCIPLGIALNVLISSVVSLLPAQLLENYNQAAETVFLGAGALVSFLGAVVLAPVTEEVIFRGLVLDRFSKNMPNYLAVILSSLLFGVMHGQLIWIVYTFIVGMLLCVVYQKSGSLLASILTHFAINASNVITGLLINVPVLIRILLAVLIVGGIMGRLMKKARTIPRGE